jgi:ubiquinone biosynthesis accessory factor UbiJ
MLSRAALAVLNHLLADAAWARARLLPFAGRTARLKLPPWQLDFAIDGIGQLLATDAEPEVEIALPADAPLTALRGAEAVAKEVHITGPAEFADALGFVLRNLRWDFEEDLSKGVGDIAAHRFAGLVHAFGAWQRQAARNLAENLAEYLTEEQPVLTKPAELADFVAGVGGLRDDLAQLEKRVGRLPS